MGDLANRTINGVFLGAMRGARRLPYERRIPFIGSMVARLLGPAAGFEARARAHLALALPECSPAERAALARACLDSFGRALGELYSGAEFRARIAQADPLGGDGLADLLADRAAGRPTLVAVGHFGNYDAFRAAMIARGHAVGALYRPMDNRHFEPHYRAAMEAMGAPLFPRGRTGIAGMVRHLRAGGLLAIAMDQHVSDGAPLTFFGRSARTTLSPAELSTRYGAALYTAHAIRQPDGLDFRVRIDPPVPRAAPEAMMQEVNDRLEAVIRAHPGQYFWVHRRWKMPAAGNASA